MASPTESFVGVAPDGTGKKVAASEFTRADGALVVEQIVLVANAQTGHPQDAPPWDEMLRLQRAILIELRVLAVIWAEETRTSPRNLAALRKALKEE